VILRVLKVLWFMFLKLFAYGWGRLTGRKDLQSLLLRDFRHWCVYVLDLFGTEPEVAGREHIPSAPGRKLVIMSNHQSQLDIPALGLAMDCLIGFVAKRELSRIPLLNYWMRQVGCVIIDRSDKRGAHQALEKAARDMGAHPLVVFPEGTRSKDGSLLPFKLGGSRLALLAEAIIIPVLIQGTRDAVENRKADAPGRIPVRVRVYPPLDTRGLGDGKAAQVKIKDYVEQCWRSPNGPT
jgi:1-acyl-sn-glycerol-3-phosphate acyltransferase